MDRIIEAIGTLKTGVQLKEIADSQNLKLDITHATVNSGKCEIVDVPADDTLYYFDFATVHLRDKDSQSSVTFFVKLKVNEVD